MNRWIARLAAALCLCLALTVPVFAGAEEAAQAVDVTKKCGYRVSEGNEEKLYDSMVSTAWSYENLDAYVGIKLPEGVRAGWLRVEWLYDPTGYELLEFDENMNQIGQRDQTASFPNIYTLFALDPQTVYLQLRMTALEQSICNIRVYSEGELPREVQQWQPPVEKADLMVVSTHQDDELIYLGGTIPYYATALKKPTVVLYMANCNRHRRNEALNALWKMGVTNYPEFINLPDEKVGSINRGLELWGGKDNILSVLVERIRRFKPEVIVTQDLNGEYGHNQHIITARAMMYAIEAAADETRYPESLEKYGAWQVKKLYHHLYKENQIVMDWKTPLEALNGYSPLEVARIGMKEHASQTKYFSVKDGGKYDNAKFGLYFTTVGQDVAKNDFLENIDPDASAKWTPTPAPIPAETAEAQDGEQADDEQATAEAALIEATPAPETLEGAGDAAAEAAPEAVEEALADAAPEAGEAAPETAGDLPAEGASEATEDAQAPEDLGTSEDAQAEIADAPAEAAPEAAEAVPAGDPFAPPAQTPVPAAAPQTANESAADGTRTFAILMGAGALAAVGLGAWGIWRASRAGAKRRRRRKGR